MATPINWPTTLPDCVQNWSEQRVPDVVRSEVSVGVPKVRRRSTIERKEVSVSWTIPATLYDDFDYFYATLIQDGIVPFYYAHPVTKVVAAYRFMDAPNIRFVGGSAGVAAFYVNARLELMP